MSALERLPVELLQAILELLTNWDERPSPWLMNISTQSRTLRRVTLPMIFRTLTILIEVHSEWPLPSGQRRNVLDFLTDNTHIASFVRNIDVKTRMANKSKSQDLVEVEKFKKLFPAFTSLRSLRFRDYGGNAFDAIMDLQPQCDVEISTWEPTFIRHEDQMSWVDPLRRIPRLLSINVITKTMGHLKDLFEVQPHLRTLSILTPNKQPLRVCPDPPHEYYTSVRDETFIVPPLAELFLEGLLGTEILSEPDHSVRLRERVTFLNNIQWHALRSLTLSGGLSIERFLTHYADKLSSVRHISLWVFNDTSNSDPFGEYEAGVKATAHFLSTSPSAENLTALELRGYSVRFPMTSITSPKLRSLRFYNYESSSQTFPIIRPASDIRHLSQQCPLINYLAIDFPEMRNLFHPTAIPGVDAEISVYPFLQALSEFPKLTHLHLFPPYTRTTSNYTTYTQPFTDDDLAIKLFKHIKTQQSLYKKSLIPSTPPPLFSPNNLHTHTRTRTTRTPSPPTPTPLPLPTLTHLHLSPTNIFTKFISSSDFDAQSWFVTEAPSNSNRFFMTLRQAGKEYEQRQVWEGERRLRTEIRRDKFPRGYVEEEEGGW
ncbi:hypothetical protein UCRPC4_g03811 [Phaeomoniella chlamydospora]|uniref:Uncharacterized protein n=1 Tax=Phaeomoniella chlamydospora TaxID=158046 RepID=A0A0G2GCM8_PHACM|nr:hypothetical protein UCRPC4_g03811 [Phaeomoniella chlamydospora]